VIAYSCTENGAQKNPLERNLMGRVRFSYSDGFQFRIEKLLQVLLILFSRDRLKSFPTKKKNFIRACRPVCDENYVRHSCCIWCLLCHLTVHIFSLLSLHVLFVQFLRLFLICLYPRLSSVLSVALPLLFSLSLILFFLYFLIVLTLFCTSSAIEPNSFPFVTGAFVLKLHKV
jgi:hypothetical protein